MLISALPPSGLVLASPGESATAVPPPLRVIYFVTRDRQPCRDYEMRLDRVMREVQRFYRDGMKADGFGEKTFALETDSHGRLRIHLVSAREDSASYGRDASDKVRSEVKARMLEQGMDIDHETIVIFQTLLSWEGAKAIEVGPYVGTGDHLSGTAWVYDDDHLDPSLLADKQPGGYYMRPCSIGEFNSHYIGGVAHELGHAFGLPHLAETAAQRVKGISLMGGGNHTYGNNLRGEGRGAFLHPLSALCLANIRAFSGDRPQAGVRPTCKLVELNAEFNSGEMIFSGRLQSDISVLGLGAYDDLESIPSDYDATGWVAQLQPEGRFRLVVAELRKGASQLRLVVAHENGTVTVFPYNYVVDDAGHPGLEAFRLRQ